jgi:arylsulfatase A-like enzyme
MKTIASILLTCTFAFTYTAVADDRPDIVLIAIDDLRPKLGCYHDPHVQTPNIDRLARRAVVFERAYCQYAKCGPSRLSLMTGLRPDSIGVYGHGKKMSKIFAAVVPMRFRLRSG